MDLPRYYIVGLRPVKVIRTNDGGMAIYAFNWETGSFELAMKYLFRLEKARNDDVERVSEEEFSRKVEELRKEIAAKKSE
ncbi:MAG: hypothetical protein B6D38_05110 [Anaerolineae bacterium UTCFX1]|jgi:hypothetical protein|nr:MAG: hypothetical protein B6D38_05110 [Anaerolineae bacterium UTCFX1]